MEEKGRRIKRVFREGKVWGGGGMENDKEVKVEE